MTSYIYLLVLSILSIVPDMPKSCTKRGQTGNNICIIFCWGVGKGQTMAGLHCPEDPCMVYLLININHTNQLYVGEYTILWGNTGYPNISKMLSQSQRVSGKQWSAGVAALCEFYIE